jgi:citronellol/citronellal dehydrogenase
MELTVKTFGGIDLLINKASAIRLAGTLETTAQHFDLRCGVNVRAT